MSESSRASTPKPQRPASLGFKIILGLVVGLLLILILPFFLVLIKQGVLLGLALGWWRFLGRTLPRISWNWDLVGMGVLSSALLAVLAHNFLNWIAKEASAARGQNWRWPWKWTLSGLVAIALLFLVGMSVGGAAHQIFWLSAQTESWYEAKGEALPDLRQLDGVVQQAVLESGGDVSKLKRELSAPTSGYFPDRTGKAPLIERFHVLLILNDNHQVAGTIIFPRSLASTPHSEGAYWFGDKHTNFSLTKLPGLIQQHQRQLLAL